MYFYVDESGNTGNNLFDTNQPYLYYGFIGCKKNLDLIAEPMLRKLRSELGVKRLHANELGVGRLVPIMDTLVRFQKIHDIRFNFYKLDKKDHAVISFFDQVFDAGLNDAVNWFHYWSPMRYILLLKLNYIFTPELKEAAWRARLMQMKDQCSEALIELCQELIQRVSLLPDERSREVISGALIWCIHNTDAIGYGTNNRESALQISPNLVGFQQVLMGIAMRTQSASRPARSIIVDQQNEFNTAQQFIASLYRKLRATDKVEYPPGMPKFDWSYMPEIEIEFRPSNQSAGLEMVDIYLWIMKRADEGRPLPDELLNLLYGQRHRGIRDEVSIFGIDRRWSFLLDLPEPDENSSNEVQEFFNRAELRKNRALDGLLEQYSDNQSENINF